MIPSPALFMPATRVFKPGVWLAILVWSILLFATAYSVGGSHARKTEKIAEQGRTARALKGLATANQKVLTAERKLRSELQLSYTNYLDKDRDEKAKTNRVITDLRRDVLRLRVPIRKGNQTQPAASGPASAGIVKEGFAELEADASVFVVELLDRGDQAIRKHAEVVDRYEMLRTACTANPEPTGEQP